MVRKNLRLQAHREEQELRERMCQLQADYSAQKNERYDIISDFTRQNKNMQDELIVRINDLESTICNLKDQLELSKIALDEIRHERDQQIKQKEREIGEQSEKMEDMSQEFHAMLKETLEKMNERIDEKHKDDSEVKPEKEGDLPEDAPPAPAAAAGAGGGTGTGASGTPVAGTPVASVAGATTPPAAQPGSEPATPPSQPPQEE